MLFELRCKGFGLFAGCLRRQPQAKSLPGARQHSICGRPLKTQAVFLAVDTLSDAAICPASWCSAKAAGPYGSSRTGTISPLACSLARWKALVLPAPSRRLLCHTLLRPTTSPTAPDPSGLCRDRGRSSITLLLHEQRPDDPRRLVGKCDDHQHARFARQHLF
jgi:hypothetical protein